MVNNGTLHYDHDRDGTHTELAGCEGKFRQAEHDTHLSIRYEKDVLTVRMEFILFVIVHTIFHRVVCNFF